MADPLVHLAQIRIIQASQELDLLFSTARPSGPLIEILRRLRERAAESLAALVLINFLDPAEIPKAVTLQNEVKRYDEFVIWLRDIVAEGKQYDRAMSDAEREENIDFMAPEKDDNYDTPEDDPS